MTLFRTACVASLLGMSAACGAQSNPGGLSGQSPAMHHEHAMAEPSTTLTVRLGEKAVTLTLADLQAMPQMTVSVFNGHSKQNETYSGPSVAEVLAKVGVVLSEKTQHEVLDSYVLASGTDGYFVVFSGAELQPGLHQVQTIVAIDQAGQPLTRNGAFQLIDSLEVKPARWVRNLASLTVNPVSAPAH